jgi:hypothetical protein
MAQRIKGQEVTIVILRGGIVEAELTDIMNFNIETDIELIQQGYLGEVADRFDEVYKGTKFDFEMHVHSQDFFVFQQAIIDRAQRVTPDIQFNISFSLAFPNGQTPSITLPDCFFGPIPKGSGSRTEYVKTKISGACSQDDTQTS